MSTRFPADSAMVLLIHERTREVIASRVELAVTRRARRVGLLGRTGIDTDAGLLLAPCFAIHTAFMRFPIDVLFVDRNGRALRIVHGLAPWRAAVSTRAHAVIELAAGVLRRHQVEVGDRVRLMASTPNSQLPTSNGQFPAPNSHSPTPRHSSALEFGNWELGVDKAKRPSW